MRLLDRYLLRELLIPLGYCLVGFVLLWVCLDLFATLRNFREKLLGAGDITEYYLVTIPDSLVQVLPIALLLALLYALTNHARHQEITAIRAAGVSLWRLCLPYLGVGLVASLALLVINELWEPDTAERANQILTRHQPRPAGAPGPNQVRSLAFTNARDGRGWQIGLYNSETGEMFNPLVMSKLPDGSHLQLKSDRAIRTNGVWTFYGSVNVFKYPVETNTLPVPVLHTNLLAMPSFTETPEQIRSEIKISQFRACPA